MFLELRSGSRNGHNEEQYVSAPAMAAQSLTIALKNGLLVQDITES